MTELRRVRDLWRRSDVTVRDLPLALGLVGASLVARDSHGTQLGNLPDRPFDGWAVLVVALQCLPVAGRRRWPVVCLGLVSLGFAADQLRGYHSVATIALPVALISAGAHVGRKRRLVALLACAAYVLFAVVLARLGPGERVSGFVEFFAAAGVAWGVGAWLRQTRRAEQERRFHLEETTRTAERTRIAAELHDVVTHHVTAMVVQAEAARYLTATPDRLDQTLNAVSDTGRRAIADLRQMLDLLNPDPDAVPARPAMPTVGGLIALVEQTRRAGQPVTLTEQGTPRHPSGPVEAATYRVVQEALTNALKHDHGARTVVHVQHGPKEVRVKISSEGSGSGAASPGGSGRGLAGLRERVDVLGGEFSASRLPGRGFVVQARIPISDAS